MGPNSLAGCRTRNCIRLVRTVPSVVVLGHVGLDGFECISDIWSGGLVGETVKVKLWRHAAAVVPAGERERTEWLYARWRELDDWIGQQQSS